MSKIVGIIGGMGPISTIELMEKIFTFTTAEREQDHLRILVDSRPEIPDRTAFINHEGESPLSMLIESAQLLQNWGADLLVIACNTAHYFFYDVQNSVSVPVLNILEITAGEVSRQVPDGGKVAILTTSGAREAELFEPYLSRYQIIYPSRETQESLLMEAVYGIAGIKNRKLNDVNRKKIESALKEVLKFQPKVTIAGCTEIELALKGTESETRIIYPLDLLAREIVKIALAL
jgi:aspartate racemase